jgi:hypothetical protein
MERFSFQLSRRSWVTTSMKNLIEAIAQKRPIVIWNPFKENDQLSRQEFIGLIKISGYSTLVIDGDWITAYQEGVHTFGHETIREDLAEARALQLHAYASILEEDLVQLSIQKRRQLK